MYGHSKTGEVVGVGSGPQDLSQYLISHMNPSERRLNEGELLKDYHENLLKGGVVGYSLQDCQQDYIEGGVGRWIWLLAVLSDMCPDDWVQYFVNQVDSFVKDWKVKNAVMPRV